MKVLSFGEILLRLASPGYTKLFQRDELEASFCGGEANVAVSLAIFGIDSEFLTKLPNNDVAAAAVNTLKYFGVDTSRIIYGNGRMGLYYLEKGASQRPSKVIYDREYSSISIAQPDEFDWDNIFEGVSWFHWTGINPALSENLAKICMNACEIAKKKGITVSCDLNFRKNLWSSEHAQKIMPELLKYVDVCIANEEDAEMALGIKAPNSNVDKGIIDLTGYEYVAKEICRCYGCRYSALTLRESISASVNGWSGMLYDSKHDEFYHSDKYNLQIVDRVGGGDSFSAGIIYSIINNKSGQQIIDFAVAASCLKHSIEGDFNRTTVDEVNNLLKNGGSGRVVR